MTIEERHQPSANRTYEGDGIIVYWEPSLCIHTANCIRGLPQTFDPQARPWVAVHAASADEIARTIETCPTGALSYRRTDGAPQEQPASPTEIQPRTNGPLFIRGAVEVVNMQGEVVRSASRLALCRCGHSANKPYCDLSHRAVGFQG